MKKIAVTKELFNIANALDELKMFDEASSVTRVAKIILAEDYKHEPAVYNPDEAKADVQEAHSMDYLDAMEALNKLVESGELEPRELSQIQAILSDADDEGPDPFKEMSYDDHFELGLGAVPHKRIKSPMNSSDYDDEDGDIDLSHEDDDFDPNYGDDSDYDDEDPGDPHAWQYEDDEDDDMLDREHRQHGGGYHHHEDNED